MILRGLGVEAKKAWASSNNFLDPDFYPFRIPDPTTAPKEEGEKNFSQPFFGATNIINL